MAASQHITSNTSTKTSTTNTSTTNTNTETLARTNKLRLQINELLNESVLHVSPTLDHHNHGGIVGGGGRDVVEAKWSNVVRSYISNVSSIIQSLDETLLSPNVALLPNTSNNSSSSSSSMDGGGNKYRVLLLSDKFYKSITSSSSSSSSTTSSSTNPLTTYTFPFHGGKSLSIIPIGSFANNVGLTNVHGNGNIIPTLDLAVLVNVDGNDKGEGGFVGGKDYLNHRYTDVSFLSVLFIICVDGVHSKSAHHIMLTLLQSLTSFLSRTIPHTHTHTHTHITPYIQTEKEYISNPHCKAIITEEIS